MVPNYAQPARSQLFGAGGDVIKLRVVGMGIALAVCSAAEAAEPAAAAPQASPAPATKPVTKPLDLRIGDVRKYMTPNEFRAVINAPDAEQNTVIVEGSRELPPSKSDRPVPGGIIAPFWALANPLQSWRIFVPDLKRPEEGPREPADKVPPPVFRWGP
jgi:hypothetical protein